MIFCKNCKHYHKPANTESHNCFCPKYVQPHCVTGEVIPVDCLKQNDSRSCVQYEEKKS